MRPTSADLALLSFFAFAPPACADALDGPGHDDAMVQGALSSGACPDDVPAELTPDEDQRLAFHLTGDGDQVYTCVATAFGAAWKLKAPDADLLDRGGEVVGSHFAGPTWESDDGSSVVGSLFASAPAPDPSAIAWLLLVARSHDGDGRMADVTSIQRLSTVGGKAPASGCDAGHVGAEARVPYQAEYYFYRTGEGAGPQPQCAP